MNNIIIKCKLCGVKMKEIEGNNPQPLLENFEDRVCRDCNDYVTATRLTLRGLDHETMRRVCDIITSVMQMANSLKQSRINFYEKEMNKDE